MIYCTGLMWTHATWSQLQCVITPSLSPHRHFLRATLCGCRAPRDPLAFKWTSMDANGLPSASAPRRGCESSDGRATTMVAFGWSVLQQIYPSRRGLVPSAASSISPEVGRNHQRDLAPRWGKRFVARRTHRRCGLFVPIAACRIIEPRRSGVGADGAGV
jgi:hypothetical protein